jgi:hypothetical protein
MADRKLIVKFEFFRGSFQSWDSLFGEAAEFGTQVGAERLIGISHSQEDSTGVVTVWYWGEPDGEE